MKKKFIQLKEDLALGESLPVNNLHAVSVSMPKWQHVIDYEEGKEELHAALKTGYPRFIYHPLVAEACRRYHQEWGLSEEKSVLLFPSLNVAKQCKDYVYFRAKVNDVELRQVEHKSHVGVIVDKELSQYVKEFWQHSGLVISSRYVEDFFEDNIQEFDTESDLQIRQRIAGFAGSAVEDVYLTTSGMTSIYYAFKAITLNKKDTTTIQLGFPYLDTLKIQERWDNNALFLDYRDASDLKEVKDIIANGAAVSAVFCEFPTNPLLDVVEIKQLSEFLRSQSIPLIIDDTLSTWYNADLLQYSEILVTSLTKYFSGVGDVMAGSVVLNANSPLYSECKESFDTVFEPLLYAADCKILSKNMDDFPIRMQKINHNAAELVHYLKDDSKIKDIFYPSLVNQQCYDQYKSTNAGSGYGGLFSIVFKKAEWAEIFYDSIKLAKGPSLGTEFTILCPYTMLAHYHEFDFAAKYGVEWHLIRISVGVEDIKVIKEAFSDALAECI